MEKENDEKNFFNKLSSKIVLAIIKCWGAQITIAKTVDQIKLHLEHEVHRNTVALLFFRLRQLCPVDIDKKNHKLGGEGKIVEIDESLYAKVKHSKGKDLKRPQICSFGLAERKNSALNENGKGYFEVVPKREAQTLLEIIYNKDYTQLTVNHTYNFLDPNTGACTNRIESLWNSSKYRFKDMRSSKRSEIQSYLMNSLGDSIII
ncbi:ISXO2-like domain-containing [Brachionus plicatilis]|uniref:ISXO2-like domain-containing n=1 Tax=Brachionus plicatilis TaxID=10195 RepID=A0A3M7PPQ2_BRAPC|nr:ISXO2-like domain-containing [Brachionus plicatilis]